MKNADLNTLLSGHSYPGRGILLGRSADNRKAVIEIGRASCRERV